LLAEICTAGPTGELTVLPDPLAGKWVRKEGKGRGGEGREDEDGDGWEGRGGCLLLLNLNLATPLTSRDAELSSRLRAA